MEYNAFITRKIVEYKRFFPLVIFSAIILIFALKIGYVNEPKAVQLENTRFQSVEIKHLFTDEPILMYQKENNYEILHFFSPSCERCLQEIPELQKIQKAGIKVIGVAISEDKQKVKNWLATYGNYFSNIGLMDFDTASALGINSFPDTIVLYKESKLTYNLQGMLSYNAINGILKVK
jgi:thiol-disulfide isomerase/thioredoxin